MLVAREAQAAFIPKKAEIDAMLARLQTLSDEHFSVHPDELTWANVDTLGRYAALLPRIADCAFREASTPTPPDSACIPATPPRGGFGQ